MHALLETIKPDYVRRRCLAHLPWRCADQVLSAIGERHEEIKAISFYLHDSGTWIRLKAIAVNAPTDGGLGLFREHSRAYGDVFSKAPPRNIAERPDTTAALLEWLLPREAALARLVMHGTWVGCAQTPTCTTTPATNQATLARYMGRPCTNTDLH